MSTKKDEKKTYINVRLDETDKRALKLNKIFDGWGAQGRHAKVNKVVENLSLIYEMEQISSLRSFLNIYKSSKDILSPIFDESEEELLYQALDELFRESIQNSHVTIATKTFQIQAKYLAMKQNKPHAEVVNPMPTLTVVEAHQEEVTQPQNVEPTNQQPQAQPQAEEVETKKQSSLDERRKNLKSAAPMNGMPMFDFASAAAGAYEE